MTSKEFTIWLKGFVKAANPYNITPAQWDAITDELEKVVDDERPSFPFGVPNVNVEPIIPFKSGTDHFNQPLTGSVTISSMWIAPTDDIKYTTTYGSSGTSIYNIPSGANVTYTNQQNTKQQLND
jgi:hypothetical protein